MPVSAIRETESLLDSDLVQFALEADREARRLRKAGDPAWRDADAESARLAAIYDKRHAY